MQTRHRSISRRLAEKNPELDRIEQKWTFLSQRDKETIYATVDTMATQKD